MSSSDQNQEQAETISEQTQEDVSQVSTPK